MIGIIQAQQEGQRLTTLTGLITSVKEDVWWRVLGVNEGDVNCGSIEVWEWLLKNTVDFAFFSSKVSTFVNPSTSKWYLSNLSSRLALLICLTGLQGVVRNSDTRRALSFFSCHCWSRRRLRAAAAGLLLFLFCTDADRLTTSSFSSTRTSSLWALQIVPKYLFPPPSFGSSLTLYISFICYIRIYK